MIAGCVAIATALVLVLLLFEPPGATEQQPPAEPTGTHAATAARSDAARATIAGAAARTEAPVDAMVTFEVVDAESSAPLDGVRIGAGAARRTVELGSLVQLGTTNGGQLSVSLARVIPDQADTKLVLTRRGYLAKVVDPPAAAGTCRVPMDKGRDTWVRVVEPSGAPLPGASVAFFGGNFELGLLAAAADGEHVTGGAGGWFASVVCDADGYASVALPARQVTILATCLGWFQAKHAFVQDAKEPDRGLQSTVQNGMSIAVEPASERRLAVDIVMHPVQCAVLAARPSRILGKSLPDADTRSWREVHSIFAWDAAALVSRLLQQRFPGDLVFTSCLVPASAPASAAARAMARDVGGPTLRVRVLVDGVGELDVRVALQRFTEVHLERLLARARPATP
ncbi:MAG TPA: hypothetical protein VFL14_01460, partial [Xanthomonadales bacterium]|nr:hypothetical protein [Xanthomonadales bacterium]